MKFGKEILWLFTILQHHLSIKIQLVTFDFEQIASRDMFMFWLEQNNKSSNQIKFKFLTVQSGSIERDSSKNKYFELSESLFKSSSWTKHRSEVVSPLLYFFLIQSISICNAMALLQICFTALLVQNNLFLSKIKFQGLPSFIQCNIYREICLSTYLNCGTIRV